MRILAFLRTLIGYDLSFEDEINAQATGNRLADIIPVTMNFHNRYVFFSHFACYKGNLESSSIYDVFFHSFRRCAAVHPDDCQPYWDIMIPVYCGELDKPFDRDLLTAFMIQVKYRVTAKPLCPGPEYPIYFRAGSPLLVLQMELGETPGPVKGGSSFPQGIATSTPSKRKLEIPPTERRMGPYVVALHHYGLGSLEFPSLPHTHLEHACREVLGEIGKPEKASDY